MRKWLFVFLWLAGTLTLPAADLITASITLTNFPVGHSTITVQGSPRTWTNDVSSSPGTLIQQTNSAPWSATNLLNHLTRYPAAVGHYLAMGNPTNVIIRGTVGEVMAVTASAGWAVITYSTQAVTTAYVVREPYTVEPPNQQTNIGSWLAKHLTLSTNPIDGVRGTNLAGLHGTVNKFTGGWYTNSALDKPWVTNGVADGTRGTNLTALHGATYLLSGGTYADYVGTNGVYTNIAWINGNVGGTLTGGTYDGGRITNAVGIHGAVTKLTGGYYTNATLDRATATNFVNRGNAISSPGTATESEQFGTAARADGQFTLSIGRNALASNLVATAIGNFAVATNENALAVGFEALGAKTNSIAIGRTAQSWAQQGVAIGTDASVNPGHDNSVAIGNKASTTGPGQMVLGALGFVDVVSVPGRMEAGSLTNAAFTGTNNALSAWAWREKTISTLAVGNNVLDPGFDSVFIRLASGPTNTFAIHSIQKGWNGRTLYVWNDTGQQLSYAHESGFDPTNVNRIVTRSLADVATGTNAIIMFIYSAVAQRWEMGPGTVTAGGEANTASNLGTPSATVQGLFSIKSGVDLRFRSLEVAGGLTLHSNANTVIASNSITRVGVYREMWVDAGAMVPSTTNGAATGTYTVGADGTTTDVLDFDDTTSESVQFKWSPPDEWDRGTIKARFYWSTISGTGGVVWGIAAGALSDDDTINGTILGTEITVADTRLADHDVHITSATAAVTVAGSPALNDLVFFKVRRLPADGSDTKTGDARLLGVKLQFLELPTEPVAW